jgi:hypothetical protein
MSDTNPKEVVIKVDNNNNGTSLFNPLGKSWFVIIRTVLIFGSGFIFILYIWSTYYSVTNKIEGAIESALNGVNNAVPTIVKEIVNIGTNVIKETVNDISLVTRETFADIFRPNSDNPILGRDTWFGNTFGSGDRFLMSADDLEAKGYKKEDRTKIDAIEKASKDRWAAATPEANEMRRLTTYYIPTFEYPSTWAHLTAINDKLSGVGGLKIDKADMKFYEDNYRPFKSELNKYEEAKKKWWATDRKVEFKAPDIKPKMTVNELKADIKTRFGDFSGLRNILGNN